MPGRCRGWCTGPRTNRGRCVARFNPLNPADLSLFRAALAGEHAIVGFRDADLTKRLTVDHHLIVTKRIEAANACQGSSSNCAATAWSPKSDDHACIA